MLVVAVVAAMIGAPVRAAQLLNAPTLPIEQKYYADGPWAVTTVTAVGCNPSGAQCDLWYPTNLGQNGFRHPIITWGNGTDAVPGQYFYLLSHLASWGFVVVASENVNTGTGQEILDTALRRHVESGGRRHLPVNGSADFVISPSTQNQPWQLTGLQSNSTYYQAAEHRAARTTPVHWNNRAELNCNSPTTGGAPGQAGCPSSVREVVRPEQERHAGWSHHWQIPGPMIMVSDSRHRHLAELWSWRVITAQEFNETKAILLSGMTPCVTRTHVHRSHCDDQKGGGTGKGGPRSSPTGARLQRASSIRPLSEPGQWSGSPAQCRKVSRESYSYG